VTAVAERGTTPFAAPKGVPDYVPPASAGFEHVRDTLLAAAARAGYGLIELPVFEDTALFARGVGESTDVVSKEMYTFADRGDRSVTLRPEGTAGVVRAVIGCPSSCATQARSSATNDRRPGATGSCSRSGSRRSASTTPRWTPRSSRSPTRATGR
jgi:histidyl-tRNA synthetase